MALEIQSSAGHAVQTERELNINDYSTQLWQEILD